MWALPDSTPVIISGGLDGTVRVWRLADATPLVPPLELPEPVRAVAVHGERDISGVVNVPRGWRTGLTPD